MIGQGTLAVNNQLLVAPNSEAFFPSSATYPYFRGSGQGPATIPLDMVNYAGAGSVAAANPWSPTQAPVWIAIVALVVGILGLRYIHWR